jgi:Spy/CpxP family protein refolding chaperone
MRPVSRNLLCILLLVSVGFNLFFIAGYRRARSTLDKLKSDRGYIQLLSRTLHFTPEQEEKLVDIRRRIQDETAGFNRSHSPEIDAFWDEIIKDSPDPDRILELEQSLAEKRIEMRQRMVGLIQEAFGCLTPEQRRELARMIKERSFLKQL